MTGALMPDYWTEAELSATRSRLRLSQWLLPWTAARSNADVAMQDRQSKQEGGDAGEGDKNYLADIW